MSVFAFYLPTSPADPAEAAPFCPEPLSLRETLRQLQQTTGCTDSAMLDLVCRWVETTVDGEAYDLELHAEEVLGVKKS